jgi:hypothetical protein
MKTYLIGTQCLLDIAKKDGNKASQWYDSLASQGLYLGTHVLISAFSVAQLRFFFHKHPAITPGDWSLIRNVNKVIRIFENAGGVLGCPAEAAYYWAETLGPSVTYNRPPPPRALPAEEAIVVATAAVHNGGHSYVLVDREQEIHQVLRIAVHDPYHP